MPVALSLQAVRVRYADRVALDGVSLAVGRGEVVGLLGPNGSGKSTTLAVAAGLLDPAEGEVAIDGVRRAADPHGYAARVGLVPQGCALYDELTPADNLAFFGRLYGIGGRELRRRVSRGLARVGLADRAGCKVGTLSGGMRQRVNLAAALLHDPPVLLLDEPAAALDPASRDALLGLLARFRDDGHAVLLSTHHPDEAAHGCDRVVVLDRGRVAADGPPGAVFGCRPGGRAVLYGHLRERPPRFLLKALRERLRPFAEVEVTGNRLRLAAGDSEGLGRALAAVLADGVQVGSFRTPAGSLDRALKEGEKGRKGEEETMSR